MSLLGRGFATSTSIIYGAVVGSHLHGTAMPSSDVDLRYVKCSTFAEFVSIHEHKKTSKIMVEDGIDAGVMELNLFAATLTKCSPTQLEVALSPFNYGNEEVMNNLAQAAMDTELYLNALKGYAGSCLKDENERTKHKSKYHFTRLCMHAALYSQTGKLDFLIKPDTVPFMRDLKYGVKDFEVNEGWESIFVPRIDHHTQDLDLVDRIIYTEYVDKLVRR